MMSYSCDILTGIDTAQSGSGYLTAIVHFQTWKFSSRVCSGIESYRKVEGTFSVIPSCIFIKTEII